MNTCKLSMIVAVYNTQEYLERCLDSIRQQTADRELYEVILVDDGSTDESPAIIDRYVSACPNFKAIHKENEGTYLCRQDGMRQARGEYVIFVDSDDWLCENAVEVLLSCMDQEKYDMLEFGIYDETPEETKVNYQLPEGIYDRNEIAKRLVCRQMTVELWHRMFSGKVICRYLDYFDSHYKRQEFTGIRIEDEYLFPALLRHVNRIRGLEIPLYHYREASSGSMMKRVEQESQVKLFHARTLIEAGFLILKEIKEDRKLTGIFYYGQIQNLFYYIGCIIKFDRYDEMKCFREYYEKWKQCSFYFPIRNISDAKWLLRVFKRKAGLRIKYLKVSRGKGK